MIAAVELQGITCIQLINSMVLIKSILQKKKHFFISFFFPKFVILL